LERVRQRIVEGPPAPPKAGRVSKGDGPSKVLTTAPLSQSIPLATARRRSENDPPAVLVADEDAAERTGATDLDADCGALHALSFELGHVAALGSSNIAAPH
jgi:hypothetical protein